MALPPERRRSEERCKILMVRIGENVWRFLIFFDWWASLLEENHLGCKSCTKAVVNNILA